MTSRRSSVSLVRHVYLPTDYMTTRLTSNLELRRQRAVCFCCPDQRPRPWRSTWVSPWQPASSVHFRHPLERAFFVVGKKDGSLRPFIDYHGIKNITVKNRYPLPLMSTVFELFQGAMVFTKLDLRNAYHLVRIREGDEWKTAFNTPTGHWEYLVMPFRLTNAPAVFQTLVNDVLRDMINKFVFVYLDDILVFSRDPEEHKVYVQKVLQRLLENRLFMKSEKCEFSCSSTAFLGYIIATFLKLPSCFPVFSYPKLYCSKGKILTSGLKNS